MTVLLDTHAWAWSIVEPKRLTAQGKRAIRDARSVLVSPISIYEIAQKVHLGKWPQMLPYLSRLPELVAEQGSVYARVEPELCLRAATLDWPHRDPFDRMLAATALHHGAAILSTDTAFDTMPGLRRIW